MISVKCFKCGKEIGPAMGDGTDMAGNVSEASAWECPCDATVFDGGYTFGSSLYDAMLCGVHPQIVVCDDCMKAAKAEGTLREEPNETMKRLSPVDPAWLHLMNDGAVDAEED